MSSLQKRQPAGRPTGGQFAEHQHAESAVSLPVVSAEPEGWPTSLPAPDVRLDLTNPASPETRVYTGEASVRVQSGGRMVSYDFTPSEADFDDIQAAIDWARAEHEKATRPKARLAALEAREALLADLRAVASARSLSWWAENRYGPGGRFEIGVDDNDPDAMTIVRGWITDEHEVDPHDLQEDLDTRINGWITGRELARLLPVKDSDWFDLADAIHPGGRFDETTYRISAGYHDDLSKVRHLGGEIAKVRDAQAMAALDYISEDAAHAFGQGAQLRFGPSEMGHMVAVAVIRADGTRVSDSEFEQWYGAAPNEDDPYLPDLCRHLPERDSAWFDRAEAIDVSEWETVFAVRVGGTR